VQQSVHQAGAPLEHEGEHDRDEGQPDNRRGKEDEAEEPEPAQIGTIEQQREAQRRRDLQQHRGNRENEGVLHRGPKERIVEHELEV